MQKKYVGCVRFAFCFKSVFMISLGFAQAGENPVILGNVRFTVINSNLIRIEEKSSTGVFNDNRSLLAVNRSTEFKDFSLSKNENSIQITTANIDLKYIANGKSLEGSNLSADITDGVMIAHWNAGLKNSENLGGPNTTLDGVSTAVPLQDGLLSKNGWYLLDDSKTPVLTKTWVRSRTKNEMGTDWYLFGYGRNYNAALSALTVLGGEVPMPRAKALGSWYSRYWPYSSDEFKQIVGEFGSHGFPLDVIVQDMDWQTGKDLHPNKWTGFTYDRKLTPDPVGFNDWLHQNGLATTLNLHPAGMIKDPNHAGKYLPSGGVGPFEENYVPFMKALGVDPKSKKIIPFDAGNEKYMRAFLANILDPLKKQGPDWWWLDWQQEYFTPSIPDLRNLSWLNVLLYENTSQNGIRGQSFSRWGGWGDHRHSIHFSGDAYTYWSALEFEVPFTAVSGNAGLFFWTHDIGGHMGPKIDEAFARWIQFGAFSAALRLHSNRAAADRRPWEYPPEVESSAKVSYNLRSKLFPYLYTSVWESHLKSIPLLRPMYYAYPNADEAYQNPQQYLFGENLLVAPIVSPGSGPKKVSSQIVWFPQGTWFNLITGEEFSGNMRRLISGDLDEIPVFLKAGVPLVMQPVSKRMGSEQTAEVHVRVYPGSLNQTSTATLYEDDRETQDYRNNGYATTKINATTGWDFLNISIEGAKGNFSGQLVDRSYKIEFAETTPSETATVNGVAVPVTYDSATRTNIVTIERTSIRSGLLVEIQTSKTNSANAKETALRRRLESLLGRPLAPDETLESLLKVYSQNKPGNNQVFVTLLELAGVGVRVRVDSPYFYSAENKKIVEPFYSSENYPVAKPQLTIDGSSYPLLTSGNSRIPLVEPVASKGSSAKQLKMKFNIVGVDVTWVQSIE